MKYTFTVEVETDDIIGAKEQIAIALENIGKATFPEVKENFEQLSLGV